MQGFLSKGLTENRYTAKASSIFLLLGPIPPSVLVVLGV